MSIREAKKRAKEADPRWGKLPQHIIKKEVAKKKASIKRAKFERKLSKNKSGTGVKRVKNVRREEAVRKALIEDLFGKMGY